ncbi:DNA repair protein RecN [Inediibacterium massiliense]|uniref:DNA repair protein RecN n=1 Tax=Inediibacterium massiliense TaxID=1658111 RepID=UPI0006B49124|nr:DNA repair protein RecN [Inediibacterium massiliense]
MLLELIIHDFALIEHLDIHFYEGLNILTGETGAGKSIIIDAVNMAIGERADKNYIRTGSDKSVIQLIFKCNDKNLENLLKDKGIDLLEDHTIILTREIYSSGRSTCRINDRVITVSLVKEISRHFIDIHGQHQHQSLLYPENHIHILDSFDEKEIYILKQEVSSKFYQLKSLENKLESLCGNKIERERKKDLLKFQIQEIDACNLKEEEETELITKHQLLSNSEKIFHIMSNAHEKLYHGDHIHTSIIDEIGRIVKDLESIRDFDLKLRLISETLQESLYTIEDVSRDIMDYRDQVEFDPALLEYVEKRLDTINDLKRKYGNNIEEILKYRKQIGLELEEIENSENISIELQEQIEKVKKEYMKVAIKLSESRRSIGDRLQNKISQELMSLNMNKATFQTHFIHDAKNLDENYFHANGIDKIEFLISTNLGEEPKPLSKVASGGELSRMMLAFKTILAKSDNISTLIFDEIDTGISGRTANIVGEKLATISQTHQILCITHLPQIALMADHHFYIEKQVQNNMTITNIKKLSHEERITELGRLLGGTSLTDLTMEHAKEMLEIGKSFKQKFLL